MTPARLAVDIGGTFTDFALEVGDKRYSRKVLTTPTAPEQGVLTGVGLIMQDAGLAPSDLGLIIHGTTLATNAIIERKGAKTALLATRGFRDAIEMAYEHRFEQYDIFMDKPPPLVPRNLRLEVPERIDANGGVVEPLDEAALAGLVPILRAEGVTSVALGYLHSYANPAHEIRSRDILTTLAPDLAITMSSEVCPEMREYERWSTACANAYVQPVMDRYLKLLEEALRARGFRCPIYLITSAGGLTTVEIARRFPIRLVESGPAGGAILAAHIANERRHDHIVSFDMGGTTAKICLIDHGEPHFERSFEVARQYRFLKGSGIPIRIPVIEMVEIGAGGGSIASVDAMQRVQVGPASAGSEPGPACYGRGGANGTVTDANLLLGRLQADRFAGGKMQLDTNASAAALQASVGRALSLDAATAALGVIEVVEENMANAARVHAVERGRELANRVMIAFGGAAPIHAARLAEKLDIATVIVPAGAGVGSAFGFLLAPIAYEVVRTRHVRLDDGFDPAPLNALRSEMRKEAEDVVRLGAPTAELVEGWSASMRYRGQGHELTVTIPASDFTAGSVAELERLFLADYEQQFGRRIPDLDVEILGWSLRLATVSPPILPCPPMPSGTAAEPAAHVDVVAPQTGKTESIALHTRRDLVPGAIVAGPALIVEDETTTMVTHRYTARIDALGSIVMTRT
ncbi:5-oxoprolinase (ATP-hydrolyzing) [Rhodopseudomonas palustris HaA2]|uniref:5-oxoprolinase (ATP-hydrolyzing) n=1 Tax=Rhodopseudomonas palustris (strain HaA2) TaxID=316058 RepID=Q2IRP6_RHOP2|nr:hydantoinase/oxoprolinase family protein [Rhodopseudomonas palustris]ABD09114.1 5-oxoprolinase (ATP-hydrolyzing) [Rhodopseudomonas palustris HaA2]